MTRLVVVLTAGIAYGVALFVVHTTVAVIWGAQ